MVETISPVVYGTRARWLGAVALHALGAAATSATFGAVVAAAAASIGAPWGRAGAVGLASVAILYASRELLGMRVPVPQLRRQVPDWWRTYFGRPVAAVLYGAGLGVGFLTFLGHGTLVVVTVGVATTGRPAVGALAMVPFGLARGLAPLVARRTRDREDGGSLVDRLSEMPDRVRSLANGVAIVAVGAAAVVLAWRVEGGWGPAAGAVVALTFAWAAASKLLGTRRWRHALAAHRLPRSLERVAVWAVPVVELLVPALAVAGRGRAAAGVAIAALAVFTAALIRVGLHGGADVPCGCFGWESVDVRTALARNAVLVVLALASLASAGPDPAIVLPAGADAVPAGLTAGALLAAALTAWRAATWFARNRG